MSLDTQLQSAFTAVGNAVKGKVSTSQLGVANGVATLGSDGKVPSTQLPSFVDDVLEFANTTTFPVPGDTGKIYVDLSTNQTYRFGGSSYVKITSGEVASVNGQTGVVSITTVTGNAGTATKLETARTVSITGDLSWSTTFDGSGNVTGTGTLVNSGVTAGTYKSVTVDTKGRVTGGTNPTTLAGFGITDGVTSTAIGATNTDYVAVFNAALA